MPLTITYDYSGSYRGVTHTAAYYAQFDTNIVSAADIVNDPQTTQYVYVEDNPEEYDDQSFYYYAEYHGAHYGEDVAAYLPGAESVTALDLAHGVSFALELAGPVPAFPHIADYVAANYTWEDYYAFAAADLAAFGAAVEAWLGGDGSSPSGVTAEELVSATFADAGGAVGAFSYKGGTLSVFDLMSNLAGGDNAIVLGSGFNDTIVGGAGKDKLIGGKGDDALSGAQNADVLTGGAGRDTMTGGLGADTFTFGKIGDSKASAAKRDIVSDFKHAQNDTIDLHKIDANVNTGGDQAFFLGGAAFTNAAGELIQTSGGGVTVLAGDVNGDGGADFRIEFSGAPVLAIDDFAF
jgi:hypothetical protein